MTGPGWVPDSGPGDPSPLHQATLGGTGPTRHWTMRRPGSLQTAGVRRILELLITTEGLSGVAARCVVRAVTNSRGRDVLLWLASVHAPTGETNRVSIATAQDEMCAAARREQSARRRARLTALIQHVDLWLDQLEERNLASRKRVPSGWQSRLDELAALLPFALDPGWLRPPSNIQAIEVLFEIQDRLMRLRSGPLPPDLIESDAALDMSTPVG